MAKSELLHDIDARTPFNVKILRIYVEYLINRLNWSTEAIDELFLSIGSHVSILDSDDNWFGIELSDRFYEAIVAATKDPDVSYKAGYYAVKSSARGIPGAIAESLLSPALVFSNINKFTAPFTKVAPTELVDIKRGKVVLRTKILDKEQDRPYICRNRLGFFEAVIGVFGCTRLSSIHSKCIYKGDHFCEYEITWREPIKYRLTPVALSTAMVTFVLCLLLSVSIRSSLEITAVIGVATYHFLRNILIRRMQSALTEQNEQLTQSLYVMEERREEQVLIKDIIKTTTAMMPINELTKIATQLIKSEMKYDRAAIGLVDDTKKKLVIKASAGFEPELEQIVNNSEFTIRPDNFSGFFIKVINTKSPILETKVQQAIAQHSAKSQELIKMLKTQAFIAAPIIFKDEVLGILSVENTDKSKKLDTNDLDLIVNLAGHLAVAISNSRSYTATQKALKHARLLEQQQRVMRKIFQKYVPAEIRDEKAAYEASLTHLENKILSVMFVDIVGFTSISENQSEERLVKLLNTFIEVINEIVTASGGWINKIIGDGLLIYFNPSQNQILSVAYKIAHSVAIINERLKSEELPSINISIGAHKGMCILGSIGYDKRLDYTLIGDTVNTTSRIQSASRAVGVNTIVFSDSLLEETGNFSYRSLGKIALKGKIQSIEIFEITGISMAKAA